MKKGQAWAPATAWIVLRDGETIDCLIEQTGRREWQAVPVRDVELEDVEAACVDHLPAGASISFVMGDGP